MITTKIIDNRFKFDKECRQDVFMGYLRLDGLHKTLLLRYAFISADRLASIVFRLKVSYLL